LHHPFETDKNISNTNTRGAIIFVLMRMNRNIIPNIGNPGPDLRYFTEECGSAVRDVGLGYSWNKKGCDLLAGFAKV
jgi:hypothetical protein